MPASDRRLTRAIREFDFETAFNEVGWDYYNERSFPVSAAGDSFTLHPVAEKRGAVVYRVEPDVNGQIPPREMRRKIDREVTKLGFEHLLVYADAAESKQIWQWVHRRPGERDAYREHTWYATQDPERLVRKFRDIEVPISEEEALTLTDLTLRLKDAFDKEEVTKQFYRDFSTQRTSFLKSIEGIGDADDQDWYCSVLINRLMFVYFLQRKRFLADDPNYLQNRLTACREHFGENEFYSFYRTFLLKLFHDGLGAPKNKRDAAMRDLLGDVPYLNGGFFQLHELEARYDAIDVPDEAFERLFDFFNQWDWTLDYRPLSEGNEINPDVLGYIFEQYINQKQMGAYYTKEDITGYITRNTLLPFILDEASRACPAAFADADGVWSLLRDDPDTYIYPALQQTERDDDGRPKPLPDTIVAGIDNVAKRDMWNTLTPPDTQWGLPTEIWRETVARRQRYDALRAKLAAGKVQRVQDLVILNLDIEQFTLDAIERCDDADLLRAFRNALREVTVLDPTCGSGAFLFAALEQLQRLYKACLERMQEFIGEIDTEENGSPQKYSDFREEIEAAYDTRHHPNLNYFVLKRILLDNLYGVDIMPEAVEVCKLRLFLKLAAQVDAGGRLEPLPDVDFNVRAGNALIGYATRDEALRGLRAERVLGGAPQAKMVFDDGEAALARIETKLGDVARHTERFRERQTTLGGHATAEDKAELKQALRELARELDAALALEYGVDAESKNAMAAWRDSHQPFHWFAEFYDVMSQGGFDVIIGNPPYVQLREVEDYDIRGYDTLDAGDLYPLVMERCLNTGDAQGWQGFIVPVSSVSTDGYRSLQAELAPRLIAYSSYDDRPSRLFDGLQHCRLTIHILGPKGEEGIHSSHYYKWMSEERPNLFETLRYTSFDSGIIVNSMPKIHDPKERAILDKLRAAGKCLADFLAQNGQSKIYYTRKANYFLQILDFIPKIRESGEVRQPSELKTLAFNDDTSRDIALCCLNSTLFRWYFNIHSDCRNLNKREVTLFPVNIDAIVKSTYADQLVNLARSLMKDLQANSEMRPWRKLMIQYIYARESKPIVDEIDAALAVHYGFTDEEVDFIINYDVKYRLGIDAFEETNLHLADA